MMRRGTAGQHRRPHRRGLLDRGSVAVEFGLLLPLLLFIVCGIVDFGRALNAQITLTQAAREGVRLEALGESNVTSSTQAAAIGLSNVTVTIPDACTSSSTPADNAKVTVSYQFSFITPIGAIASMFGNGSLGNSITLTASGVEPCEE